MSILTDQQRYRDWETLLAEKAKANDLQDEGWVFAVAALAICERLEAVAGHLDDIKSHMESRARK